MVSKKSKIVFLAVGILALAVGVGISLGKPADEKRDDSVSGKVHCEGNTVTVTEAQARLLKVEAVGLRDFADERETVGYIDFNQERTVQVFAPWAGRINQVFVKAGDDVKKGDTLFTIDSPDLLQAESSLISTAGVLQLTSKSLERARQLAEIKANSQKELEQAIADQQTAEGNYKAARNAVRLFGKSEAEMDRLLVNRQVEGQLTITSPLSGRVTARNAAPGLLVQPGVAPAPILVADLSTMWMIATVPESLLPRVRHGAKVAVSLMAYPGREFEGKITHVGAAIDPATHSLAVRSEIADPRHELFSQMLATFVIRTGEPMNSPALPQSGIVREGDGTTTAYVTQDGRRFERRVVKTGVAQNGMQQIIDGLAPGEKAATDGALFLSNALALVIH